LDIPKRDNFFKDIMVCALPSRNEAGVAFDCQINQILMARIMAWKFAHERKKDHFTMSEQDMLRLIIDETRDFSRFFDDKKKRMGSIQQMQKLLRKSPVDYTYDDRAIAILYCAKVNQNFWGSRGKGDFVLTSYDDVTENLMHELLQDEDKSDAMRYAQKGYITKEFLGWLLTKKEEYNILRSRGLNYSYKTLRDMIGIMDD
jgi:hypothetical protein